MANFWRINITTGEIDAVGSGPLDMVSIQSIGTNIRAVLIERYWESYKNFIGSSKTQSITGSSGNDIIIGLGGIDDLRGENGSDVYLFTNASEHKSAEITDIGIKGVDEIRFFPAKSETLRIFSGDIGIENVVIDRATKELGANINAALAPNGLTIEGNAGSNKLVGSAFSDKIFSGPGSDNLTGGLGSDFFVFDTTPGPTPGQINVDRITDFNADEGDKIQFGSVAFSGFAHRGVLTNDEFYSAPGASSAHDGSDRVIYNTTSGKLYYDADGQGGRPSVQIAVLGISAHPNLKNTDFQIINRGNSDSNEIIARMQSETITGGHEADQFMLYPDKIINAKYDTITDFRREDGDQIQFSLTKFRALLGVGHLAENQFWAGPNVKKAHDASDRVIYDTKAGNIYYDADGTGSKAAAILIAHLAGQPDLTYFDIQIIA